jgi:hypothetical protein
MRFTGARQLEHPERHRALIIDIRHIDDYTTGLRWTGSHAAAGRGAVRAVIGRPGGHGRVLCSPMAGAWRGGGLRCRVGCVHRHPVGLSLSGAAGGSGLHDLAVLGSGDDRMALGRFGSSPEPVLDGTVAPMWMRCPRWMW